MSRCYGKELSCTATAKYHALADWSFGTLMLCGDCIAWERQANGLIWAHSIREGCPMSCPVEVPVTASGFGERSLDWGASTNRTAAAAASGRVRRPLRPWLRERCPLARCCICSS